MNLKITLLSVLLALSCGNVPLLRSQQAVPPRGVIAGRVVDDQGRPMRRAQVQAFSYENKTGPLQLSPIGKPASSNDRGEFRLFWIEPGEYYLAITPPAPPNTLSRNPLGYFPATPDNVFVTTYYPGTADLKQAERVRIGRGEVDVHAITMAALATHRIRGRIVAPEVDRAQLVLLTITIQPGGQPNGPMIQKQLNQAFGTGEFELVTGAGPGSYELKVHMRTIENATYAGSALVMVDGVETGVVTIPVGQIPMPPLADRHADAVPAR